MRLKEVCCEKFHYESRLYKLKPPLFHGHVFPNRLLTCPE